MSPLTRPCWLVAATQLRARPRGEEQARTVGHDRSHLGEFRSHLGLQAFEKPSGRPDLNRRPLDPQPCIPIATTRSGPYFRR